MKGHVRDDVLCFVGKFYEMTDERDAGTVSALGGRRRNMSIKENNRVILGLLVVLAVLVVILAAAVGVRVSVWQRNIKTDEILSILNESVKLSGEEWNRDDRIKTSYAADYPEDGEIRKALMTYQEYIDENEAYFDGYLLAYLDEDDIPELIVIGNCEAAGQMIITYRDGELLENQIGRLGGLQYAKKQNFYYNSNGNMGHYYDEFYRLINGEQMVIMSGRWGDKYDEEGMLILNEEGDYPEQEYVWNGTVCSEEEYYDAIDRFVKETVGDAELIEVDSYGDDSYNNILDAYEGLKYRKYAAFWSRINEFTLENGVLTFSVGGGAYYGWGGEEIEYTVSYPVAKDCKWEDRGRGGGEHYQLEVADTDYLGDTTFDDIKAWIDQEKKEYDETVAQFGRDEAWVESPVSVVVVVKEGIVVRVYTVIS